MKTTTATSSALERAVSEYSAAERALRTVIENAEKLRSTDDALRSSEKLMAEGSSALYEAANELAITARELKITSVALRAIEPGRVLEEVADLRAAMDTQVASLLKRQTILIAVACLGVLLGVAGLVV